MAFGNGFAGTGSVTFSCSVNRIGCPLANSTIGLRFHVTVGASVNDTTARVLNVVGPSQRPMLSGAAGCWPVAAVPVDPVAPAPVAAAPFCAAVAVAVARGRCLLQQLNELIEIDARCLRTGGRRAGSRRLALRLDEAIEQETAIHIRQDAGDERVVGLRDLRAPLIGRVHQLRQDLHDRSNQRRDQGIVHTEDERTGIAAIRMSVVKAIPRTGRGERLRVARRP